MDVFYKLVGSRGARFSHPPVLQKATSGASLPSPGIAASPKQSSAEAASSF